MFKVLLLQIELYKNQMKDMEAAWEKRLAAARKETEVFWMLRCIKLLIIFISPY